MSGSGSGFVVSRFTVSGQGFKAYSFGFKGTGWGLRIWNPKFRGITSNQT